VSDHPVLWQAELAFIPFFQISEIVILDIWNQFLISEKVFWTSIILHNFPDIQENNFRYQK